MSRPTRIAARLGLAALVVCALLTAGAATAHAAEAVYEVQLWVDDEPGRSLLLVNVTLPEETEMPATVVIPLPEEAEVVWAGEIRGPDSSMDVERSYTETEAAGARALQMTVDGSRVVQYEAAYRETEVTAETRTSTLEWTQSVPAEALWVAVQFPPGAEDVVVEPEPTGDTLTNELGQSLYVYEPIEPEPNETIQVRATYVQGDAPGLDGDGDGGMSRTTILVGLALLAAFGVALVWFLLRRTGGEEAD
jgi:hypothetical protein